MYSTPSSTDILIMCALKDEYDQLIEVNNEISKNWQEFNVSDRNASKAEFVTDSGTTITIVATWVASMGRESVQAVVGHLISELNPKCLAMSGICAGRRGKTQLGDVIFADRLWSYDAGKRVVENGIEVFQGDMLQYKLSETIVQNMQRTSTLYKNQGMAWMELKPQYSLETQESWVLSQLIDNKKPTEQDDFDEKCPDWSDVILRLRKRGYIEKPVKLTEAGIEHIQDLLLLNPKGLPAEPDFSVHVAPIATGATVTEDEQIFNNLSSYMRKVLGLDMEGSGLAASADSYDIPFIFAKGVSDFADPYKDDRYRTFAARASAELLILLLRNSESLFNRKEDKLPEIESDNMDSDDIVRLLAELYPDFDETQVLWERAGGKLSDLENKSRPYTRWHTIWKKVNQGSEVTPKALLQIIQKDNPQHIAIKSLLNAYHS
ncbi:5'-methylthioadenosine/S-adenosylhomocysteine nucleosidase family protein [Psychrobacter sp. ANT_H3]|uniref:5'-methylthioadenosine/S-adenosylhomocysteine nucleosidase family protein n=1 Tax=Psychrobacter sp. ANT_H3 TaxID=3019444 RepID=UPI0022F1C4BA|nr:hypothetical protein [Psychrobacter sp. ANT_H3]MDA5133624.1 hypothetical protein [Psychrobacter sp. ANT_H3]